MKAKIALATVSGKAYYKLANELKERGLPFLSLTPTDQIPLGVEVVITTQKERDLITHPNTLVFEDEADPATVVHEAVRVVQGKQSYDRVVVGVDPGKTFGIVVLGDEKPLETVTCSSLKETVNTILKALSRVPAKINVVKIGDGAPAYTKELLRLLDKTLLKETTIEIVSEAGTSHLARETFRQRGDRDVMSAMKIAERKGQVFPRRKKQ